jgi:PAS domain S-box-containing protein
VSELRSAIRPTLEHDLQVLATTKLVEALVRSENSMRLRLDMLSEVVFELDRERRLTFLNGAWSRLGGHAVADCLGSPLSEYLDPQDRDALHALLEGAGQPRAGTTTGVTCRLEREDGLRSWVEIEAASTLSGGWIGTMCDVTRVKAAMERLELLSLVADHTDNFVIITDAEGKARWANRAFCQFTGYALEDVLDRKPGALLQGPHTDGVEVQRIAAELRLQRSFRSEVLNYTRSGRPYWVTMHVTPIFDADGNLRSFVSVQADSTQWRELNAQLLREKLRAEQADQAKSRFLSNISHEIRTPLNALTGLLDVLRTTPLDDRQLDYVQKMSTASRVLMQLINDVLDFSKIDADMMRLDPQPFALRDLWDDVADMLAAAAAPRGLEIRLDRCFEDDACFVGDEPRLRQILLNLISNAAKFTESGFIEFGARLLAHDARDGTLEFFVRDTGIGIPPDRVESIFEAFSQADASTARQFGGTGLGLAISRRLARLMGGEIQVRSAPGRGSSFNFRVTLARCAPVTPRRGESAAQRPPPQMLRGLRLLLAEDNSINQLVAKEILHLAGAEVEIVDDGEQAVQAVEADPRGFDLVLMDLNIPRLDGHAAARRILAGNPGLPVVAMSANTGDDDRARSLAAGMRAHIGKPFEVHDLLTTILEAVTLAGLRAHASDPASATPAPRVPLQGLRKPAAASEPTPGVDVDAALARLGGDMAMYRRLLAGFEPQLAGLLERLDSPDVLSTRPWPHVHAVKGAAATLGLTDLARALAACEACLRDPQREDWEPLHGALLMACAEVGASLRQLAGPDEAPEPDEAPLSPDSTDIGASLLHLRRLLHDSDMEALRVFRQIAPAWQDLPPDASRRLGQALEALDFQRALQELDRHAA